MQIYALQAYEKLNTITPCQILFLGISEANSSEEHLSSQNKYRSTLQSWKSRAQFHSNLMQVVQRLLSVAWGYAENALEFFKKAFKFI